MDRDRDRFERDPRTRNFGERRDWEDHGESRRWRRQDHDERDEPYGVGAEAAYGAPGDERDTARRYRMAQARRERDRERDNEIEHEPFFEDRHPGYNPPVHGQTSIGGFFTPDSGETSGGMPSGEDLRRLARGFDKDYVAWRNDQLDAHDRDYRAWREEQRRAYDADYTNWRRERQEKFGKDFTDWRTRQTSAQPGPATQEPQRRPLSASRPDEPKKHDA